MHSRKIFVTVLANDQALRGLDLIVENTTVRYLDGQSIRAVRPEGGVGLRLEIRDEQTLLAARIKRIFPMSKPTEYLSIQTGDGKEVAILKDLRQLDPETRKVIEDDLDRRYFTPIIDRILTLKQEAGMWRFVVSTQRGEAQFFVRNWRDNAHELAPNRWIIFSVDGARYEIKDLEGLDVQSRKLMDQIL